MPTERNTMPRIMIRCPNTGKEVFIGIRAFDRADYEAMRRGGFSGQPIGCLHCGEKHPWTAGETFLGTP